MIRIGFVGKKQHGKTTCAGFVPNVTRLSFSDPMVAGLHAGLLSQGFHVDLADFYGDSRHPAILRILQILGTDYIRDKDPLGHVRILETRICGSCTVENVRFQNEAEMLRRNGFRIVQVVRPNYYVDDGRDSNHRSETEMDSIDVDYTIVNDGTLADLRQKVELMVIDFEGREDLRRLVE